MALVGIMQLFQVIPCLPSFFFLKKSKYLQVFVNDS